MASITNYKRLFDRYQEEGAKQGISIAQYCQMNGIVFNQFDRWYKQYRNAVAAPVERVNEKDHHIQKKVKDAVCEKSVSRIIIELSNGLQITHREIGYRPCPVWWKKSKDYVRNHRFDASLVHAKHHRYENGTS